MLYSCAAGPTPTENRNPGDTRTGSGYDTTSWGVFGKDLFTAGDARYVIGEAVHQTESLLQESSGYSVYKSAYAADSADNATGKTGNVYFMAERFDNEDTAKQTYSSIKKGNESHEGVENISGLGDEAYFHSDGENFYFILIRKGERMLRLKVNKVTSKTSKKTFMETAIRIAEKL